MQCQIMNAYRCMVLWGRAFTRFFFFVSVLMVMILLAFNVPHLLLLPVASLIAKRESQTGFDRLQLMSEV